MTDLNKLFYLNKNSKELFQILNPQLNVKNQELFFKTSKNQRDFNESLNVLGIKLREINNKELESKLITLGEKIDSHISNNKDIDPTRLDLDIAKLVHKNLLFPRRILSSQYYDFWRAITLTYFIRVVNWRWIKHPSNTNFMSTESKTSYGRALGVTSTKESITNEFRYTNRPKRIDMMRYWWLGQRLFDSKKKYYYVDKLSEKFKNKDSGTIQDFINLIEGNQLLSFNNQITKYFVESLLKSQTKIKESEMRKWFTKYNSYRKRLFLNADQETIQKEILE